MTPDEAEAAFLDDDAEVIRLEMNVLALHQRLLNMAHRDPGYVGVIAMVEQAISTAAGAREAHRAYRRHMIATIRMLGKAGDDMTARAEQLEAKRDGRSEDAV